MSGPHARIHKALDAAYDIYRQGILPPFAPPPASSIRICPRLRQPRAISTFVSVSVLEIAFILEASALQLAPGTGRYYHMEYLHMRGLNRNQEASFITAAVAVLLILFLLAPFLLVLAPIMKIYLDREKISCTRHARALDRLRIIFELVWGQVSILALMCINFSTVW